MFTKRDRQRMAQALRLAIDYRESLIDAYRTNLRRTPDGVESCFHKHDLPNITKWRRDIAAFSRLRNNLRESTKEKDR